MSTESFAALRRHAGEDLAKLAEEHYQQDLTETDRTLLRSASSTITTYAGIGTLVGLLAAGYLARRIRQNRTAMYQAFRAREKPTHVRFADGREEAIPDITPLLKPTAVGDVATYALFAVGGVFVGGETGLLVGGQMAKRSVTAEPESRKRIEDAFRRFRAEVLRKQAQDLEGTVDGKGLGDPWL